MTARSDTPALLGRLATLSDLARLRVLRLVEHEELSVGELARALQLPQSTVSRHLKLLHDGGWVVKRTAGTASLYRVDPERLAPEAHALWTVTRDQLGTSQTFREDDERVAGVLAERRVDSQAFFGTLGGEWDRMRRELFGESFTCEALLGLVGRESVVADLGCGTGDATAALSPFVKRIIAVDREPAMLEAARRRLQDAENVEFLLGELTELPIPDASLDAAVVSLVLHHVPEPGEAIREIARTLKAGGVLLIIDMAAHDRQTYRHTMGHLHLGFDSDAIRAWADATGLVDPLYRRLKPDTRAKGPGLFVATMRRAEA